MQPETNAHSGAGCGIALRFVFFISLKIPIVTPTHNHQANKQRKEEIRKGVAKPCLVIRRQKAPGAKTDKKQGPQNLADQAQGCSPSAPPPPAAKLGKKYPQRKIDAEAKHPAIDYQ